MNKNSFSFVSIIIPCRNEEQFIAQCLDSLLSQDYPKENLEILVIDGMSEDETRKIVERYSKQHSYIKLLNNPKKTTPSALNIGVTQAKGEIIMKIDAHATYEKDYISKCVKYLKEYRADNVGGILKIKPSQNTLTAKAITFCLSHRFGAGNSYMKTGTKNPREVDTVAFGCWRKEVFGKVGLFDERFVRSQDFELNSRLKKAGGKIFLVPDIVATYHPEANFFAFLRHNFTDGAWVFYPLKFGKIVFSWRHLIPFLFVLSLVSSGILSIFFSSFLWLFYVISISYLFVAIYLSLQIAFQQRDFRYLFLMPIVFANRHLGYGLGSFSGLLAVFLPIPQQLLKTKT